jgi:hypothetical protein
MDTFTIIDATQSISVQAKVAGGRVLIEPASLTAALGWEVHDGLLCNEAMCIPVADAAALVPDGGIDLHAFAQALDRPLAVDLEERAACLGGSARERGDALASQQAPDFALPDLGGRAHRLSEHRGKKILLVVWASW